MAIVVQKFGGTSLSNSRRIWSAASTAIRAQQEGNKVIVVASAPGRQTDLLIAQAREISDRPPARELDRLLSTGEQVSVALFAIAVSGLGHKAISIAGSQLGIRTDSTYTKARIRKINTKMIRQQLDLGNIVVAAGFQGVDKEGNVTTLGRGGSDTTAVALAAALRADACEIYTDVDGVFTADPQLVPTARKLHRINYDEMLELASMGAGVVYSRAVEIAKKFGVQIYVRSSFHDVPGTLISEKPESLNRKVIGAAFVKDETLVTILGLPDRPGIGFTVFSRIAERNVPVDMIVQNVATEGLTDLSFTVPKGDLPEILEACEEVVRELGTGKIQFDEDISKISVVGLGMERESGVAQKMFQALSEARINIIMITTSEIKISVLVGRQDGIMALRNVHDAFDLDQPSEELPPVIDELLRTTSRPLSLSTADQKGLAHEVETELQEHLMIEDILLDVKQSLITIEGVPDEPGSASQIFEAITEAGISVDMIVQDVGIEGRANLSFTVSRTHLDDTISVLERTAHRHALARVKPRREVAKLSILGIGLRSHVEVALDLFRALSDARINVDAISTSEVRVNILLNEADGQSALRLLRKTFKSAMMSQNICG